MDILRHNPEQVAEALKQKQKWARELKVQYMNIVANPNDNGSKFGGVRDNLAKLIGEQNFPMMNNWANPEVMQAWVDQDLNDPDNSSENSEIGKLLRKQDVAAAEAPENATVALGRTVRETVSLLKDMEGMEPGSFALEDAHDQLAELVGAENVDAVINGEMQLDDVRINGTIGELRDQLGVTETREASPRTERTGPLEGLKNAVRKVFAEAGRLNPVKLLSQFRETSGNWWKKISEKFSGNKTESASNANETEDSFWYKLGKKTKTFGPEMMMRIQEILKSGDGSQIERLNKIIETNPDLRDQLVTATGIALANLAHLNPAGLLTGVGAKIILDSRARGRAEEAGVDAMQKRVHDRYLQATDRRGFNARRDALNNQPSTEAQTKLNEFNSLEASVGQKYDELADQLSALEEQVKAWRRKLNKGGAHGNSANAKRDINKNIAEALPKIESLKAELAGVENSEAYQRLLDLANEVEDEIIVQKEPGVLRKTGRVLGNFFRVGAEGLAVYSNISKKALVGVQRSGKVVENFVNENHAETSDQRVDATVAGLTELMKGLTASEVMKRAKGSGAERKKLRQDAEKVQALLAALIDLGIFGDIIPRNIGHKQINALFGRTESEENKLIRNPELLAELRTKAMEAVKVAADSLQKNVSWDELDSGTRNALAEINRMSNHTEGYLKDRLRSLDRWMTVADVIGMFANGGIAFAATHLEDARHGAEQIRSAFDTEGQLVREAGRVRTGGIGPDALPNRGMSPNDGNSIGTRPESPTTTEVQPITRQTALQAEGVTARNDQFVIDGNEFDYMNNNGTLRLNPDGSFQAGEAVFINGLKFNNLGEVIVADLNNVNGIESGTFSQILNATIDLARGAGRTFTPDEMALIVRGFNGEFGAEVASALSRLGNSHQGLENIPMIFEELGIATQ